MGKCAPKEVALDDAHIMEGVLQLKMAEPQFTTQRKGQYSDLPNMKYCIH